MKIIGITGGVGAGKSTVLDIIRESCSCYILIADKAAHEVERKGQPCYAELVELLGSGILTEDGEIDKRKMAAAIFSGDSKDTLNKVNSIVHPRVKEYVLKLIDDHRKAQDTEWFFIEAALLIEDGYKAICDELWYVYADEEVRAERLRRTRGYSEEKIRDIMRNQSSEEVFRKNCNVVIENNWDMEETRKQIQKYLGICGPK